MNNAQYIRLEWDELKAVIDYGYTLTSTGYYYDYADNWGVSIRTVTVKQSEILFYYCTMLITNPVLPGSDQEDFDINYLAGIRNKVSAAQSVNISIGGNEVTSTITSTGHTALDVNIVQSVEIWARLRTDGQGRLLVTPVFIPPEGSHGVDQGGTVMVAEKGGEDYFWWTIPDGVKFILSRFEAGAYIPKALDKSLQLKCELWYYPNGQNNNVNSYRLSNIYLQGISEFAKDFGFNFYGDGVAEILMHTTNFSLDNIEITRIFRGFYYEAGNY